MTTKRQKRNAQKEWQSGKSGIPSPARIILYTTTETSRQPATLQERLQDTITVGQVTLRLPSGLMHTKSDPLDEEVALLSPTATATNVQDILNLELQHIIDKLRCWTQLLHLLGRALQMWLQLANVEDVVQPTEARRKINAERHRIDLRHDGKRANIPRRKLPCQPLRQRQMLC